LLSELWHFLFFVFPWHEWPSITCLRQSKHIVITTWTVFECLQVTDSALGCARSPA
jgi:hypothetical protein